jgi:hypothetical protein
LQQRGGSLSAIVNCSFHPAMNPPRPALAFLVGTLLTASAWAGHRHHSHFGFYVGVPWGYPAPYYYEPAPRIIVLPPSPPPVYIEQTPAPATSSWYYCDAARAYYPYVRECPGGWIPVSPSPSHLP